MAIVGNKYQVGILGVFILILFFSSQQVSATMLPYIPATGSNEWEGNFFSVVDKTETGLYAFPGINNSTMANALHNSSEKFISNYSISVSKLSIENYIFFSWQNGNPLDEINSEKNRFIDFVVTPDHIYLLLESYPYLAPTTNYVLKADFNGTIVEGPLKIDSERGVFELIFTGHELLVLEWADSNRIRFNSVTLDLEYIGSRDELKNLDRDRTYVGADYDGEYLWIHYGQVLVSTKGNIQTERDGFIVGVDLETYEVKQEITGLKTQSNTDNLVDGSQTDMYVFNGKAHLVYFWKSIYTVDLSLSSEYEGSIPLLAAVSPIAIMGIMIRIRKNKKN